jgi:hypothetical protein
MLPPESLGSHYRQRVRQANATSFPEAGTIRAAVKIRCVLLLVTGEASETWSNKFA